MLEQNHINKLNESAQLTSNVNKNLLNEVFQLPAKHPFTVEDIVNSGNIANALLELDLSVLRADREILSNPNLSKNQEVMALNNEFNQISTKYFNATHSFDVGQNSGDYQNLSARGILENKKEIKQTKLENKELGAVSGVDQGNWGDCWFESSLAALARSKPGQLAIANMITKNKNNTYTVTFPGFKHHKIIVSEKDIKHDKLSNDAKWANILEAAVIKRYPKLVNNGASATKAMHLLTDQKTKTSFIDSNSNNQNITQTIENALKNNELLTAGTKNILHNRSIVNDHDYTVIDYDPTTQYITLRNPFGDNANSGNLPKDTAKVGGAPVDGVLNLGNGLIAMTIDTFKQNFDVVQHTIK